jgi:hypothetical protein
MRKVYASGVASPEDAPVAGPLLYHYGGVASLLGIIERRCLWASDVWFFNDASEVRYAQSRMLARCASGWTGPATCPGLRTCWACPMGGRAGSTTCS